jgi:hypothetical protein
MAFKYFKESQQKQPAEVQVRNPELDLTQFELELILRLLAQTSFPVKEIETLYIALYKLQEQHKQLSNERKG